jgi:hypothetical protein
MSAVTMGGRLRRRCRSGRVCGGSSVTVIGIRVVVGGRLTARDLPENGERIKFAS